MTKWGIVMIREITIMAIVSMILSRLIKIKMITRISLMIVAVMIC